MKILSKLLSTSGYKKIRRHRNFNTANIVGLAILWSLSVSSFSSNSHPSSKATLRAIPVNAFNERLGEPVSDLRFLGEFIFARENGICGDSDSSPVERGTPMNAQLCTYLSPDLYSLAFDLNTTDAPELLNIPYSDFPHIVNYSGETEMLPQANNVPWYETANGSLVEDYTLSEWFKARGTMTFNCSRYGNSFRFRAKNMVPGGLYTTWGIIFDRELNALLPLPQPFGGTSANTFVADINGRINSKRFINTCVPSIPEDDRFQLVMVSVAYHADGQTYGAAPHIVQAAPHIGPGMNAMPHLQISIPEKFHIQ